MRKERLPETCGEKNEGGCRKHVGQRKKDVAGNVWGKREGAVCVNNLKGWMKKEGLSNVMST